MASRRAADWKRLYAAERAALGPEGLAQLFRRAPRVALPPGGALLFPHTRLAASGHLTAAVAAAVLDAGCAEVLALGVLHGGRERDAATVLAARSGDGEARAALRRIHGPGAPDDAGLADEEFSLDGFQALLDAEARRRGVSPPTVLARYPFLVGEDPESVAGLHGLRSARARGAAVVGTADPIHHGAGYGTPEAERRPEAMAATSAWARAEIERGLHLLCHGKLAAFRSHAEEVRSDFRDVGPILAALLARPPSPLSATILALELVDYADILQAPHPTWVAAPLLAIAPA